MMNNLFNSWRKPDDDNPVKIGDRVRFKSTIGVMVEGTIEFMGRHHAGARVTSCNHWAYGIGEIVTVGFFQHRNSLEVYR